MKNLNRLNHGSSKVSSRVLCVLFVAALTACSSSTQQPPQPLPSVTVSLSPSTASIGLVGTFQFTANVTGDPQGRGVIWSVSEGPAGGSVNASGLYTAPSVAGTYHVIAVSRADPAGTDTAAVTVTAAAPTLTAFTPGSGQVGTSVTVTGTNFLAVTAVKFNGVAATSFQNPSATQVLAIVPGAATTGRIAVTATGGTATSASDFTVTTVAAPTLISFSPLGGHVGDTVTLTGTNFISVSSVTFDGFAGPIDSSTSTQIVTRVPPGASTGKIVVRAAGGSAISSADFIVVTGFEPAIFSITDRLPVGSRVTIEGANLDFSPRVEFNGANAAVTVIDSGRIDAIVPNNATTGPLTVTTTHGSASTLYTLIPPFPSFQFSPNNGVPGDVITLTGNYLATTRSVIIATGNAEFQVISDEEVHATVPLDAHLGSGSIIVATDGGTTTRTGFLVTARTPNITDIQPRMAVPGFGPITLTGTRFVDVQSVTIAGALVTSYTVVSHERIDLQVPDDAVPGVGHAVVTNLDGTGMSTINFIILSSPTVITSVDPLSGLYGETAHIHGENFYAITSVAVNGRAATGYIVNDPTLITFRVPSTATSGPVTVNSQTGGMATSPQPFIVFGTFAPISGALNQPRSNHTATLISTGINAGKVLLAGGLSSGAATETAELFNAADNTFTPTGSLHTARAYHTATVLPDGQIAVLGGGTGDGSSAVDSVEFYDPDTGTFTLKSGTLVSARRQHTATLISDNEILVTGGTAAAPLRSAELYSISDDGFSSLGDMSNARWGHTATALNDAQNRVLIVAGGTSAPAGTTAEFYTPGSGFSDAGSFTGARQFHTAVLRGNGKVVIVGGSTQGLLYDLASGSFSTFNGTGLSGAPQATPLVTGEILYTGVNAFGRLYYDSDNSIYTTVNSTTTRNSHTATYLMNGKVLLAGGTGTPGNTAELFDYGQ